MNYTISAILRPRGVPSHLHLELALHARKMNGKIHANNLKCKLFFTQNDRCPLTNHNRRGCRGRGGRKGWISEARTTLCCSSNEKHISASHGAVQACGCAGRACRWLSGPRPGRPPPLSVSQVSLPSEGGLCEGPSS